MYDLRCNTFVTSLFVMSYFVYRRDRQGAALRQSKVSHKSNIVNLRIDGSFCVHDGTDPAYARTGRFMGR